MTSLVVFTHEARKILSCFHLIYYWVAVGEPSHKMRTGLSPPATSKMSKLRNSYPEDIAYVLCFLRVFQTTEEYVLCRLEDSLCCLFLEWKLQVDLTVKQMH